MRHLVLLVDALGWLTVERTRFLEDLLPFRRRLTTVFGYSSTAVPSLLTGALPQQHKHWFLFRRAGAERPFASARWLARLPGRIRDRGRVRGWLQEHWRRRLGIRGYFSLYNVPLEILADLEPTEREDTWAPGAFPGTPSLLDHLRQGGRRYHVSDWRIPDPRKLERARTVLATEDPEVVVLYLTGIDALQHDVGTRDPRLDAALERLADEVQDLVERAGGASRVTVSLFSDHGMTDVVSTRDLRRGLESAGLVRGRDYDGFLDSTVARFWNIRNRERLEAALDAQSWGRRLSEETLQEWGVAFPGREYGDLFFLADPGELLVPSDMGAVPLAAMHGYDPSHPTSDACFLADREVPLAADHITAVLPAVVSRWESR